MNLFTKLFKRKKSIERTKEIVDEIKNDFNKVSLEIEDTNVTIDTLEENLENDKNKLNFLYEDFKTLENNMLKDMPTWMRFNYVANQVSKQMEHSINPNINWDRVNFLLENSNDPTDYNVFSKVSNLDELLEEREKCMYASSGIDPNVAYIKKICKSCKDTFYITFGERRYFNDKNLELPKRCIYCRKNMEKPKSIVIEKKEEEPMKTAFELAFEKAGIVKENL